MNKSNYLHEKKEEKKNPTIFKKKSTPRNALSVKA